MTYLVNNPADFAVEALAGLVAAHPTELDPVMGGVVRAQPADAGRVAVLIGGGTGHYPAFAGWVGPGLADAAACGNIFASPAASEVESVARAAERGGGILMSFGNYAGDVLQFGRAAERLRRDGIDVRILTVTDDIASAPADRTEQRRGIAGDLVVFKIAGAAAAEGLDLDAVESLAVQANAATRTMGVAFSGVHLPGADEPLFTVPAGRMGVGLGIHGEPGLSEEPRPDADALAAELVDRVLAEESAQPVRGKQIAVLFNGLGTVKYEELFVAFREVNRLLTERGYTVIAPVVGEQCTSLDMAGVSLTVTWLDDELQRLWCAPCDSPAFRRAAIDPASWTEAAAKARQRWAERSTADDAPARTSFPPAGAGSRRAAAQIAAGAAAVRDHIAELSDELGRIDAVAGDGDHGIGMRRGATAAAEAAATAAAAGAGAASTLLAAGQAWSTRAGGASGALWEAALTAAADTLDDDRDLGVADLIAAASAASAALGAVGGAGVGDKTMVDAAEPFAQALRREGEPVPSWAAAVAAAQDGTDYTATIVSRRGRSQTHGAASIGTPDPGAVSFTAIVRLLGELLSGDRALGATGSAGTDTGVNNTDVNNTADNNTADNDTADNDTVGATGKADSADTAGTTDSEPTEPSSG